MCVKLLRLFALVGVGDNQPLGLPGLKLQQSTEPFQFVLDGKSTTRAYKAFVCSKIEYDSSLAYWGAAESHLK